MKTIDTAPRDGRMVLVHKRPVRKKKLKYSAFEAFWDGQHHWTVVRSRPRGITCGALRDDELEGWEELS